MPDVVDGINQELYCPHCGNTKAILKCCNRNMNIDLRDMMLFCPLCGREVKIDSCCGEVMQVRKRVEP